MGVAGQRRLAYPRQYFYIACNAAELLLKSKSHYPLSYHSRTAMSVRVVARVRPLLKAELEKDQIVNIQEGEDNKPSIIRIPNPKNLSEEYSFQFNSVYDQDSTQQQLFDAEGSKMIRRRNIN
jgi:hypothetical protein